MSETFEHYQLLRNDDGSFVELGHGAMGITYKAFDTNLRCHVALKVIGASLLDNEIAAERFLREARGSAQLRHRNVAAVFHLGKRADSFFYAMEFIDGETVDALVKRDGPLDCGTALDIAQQVACALMAAEKQHLVHRDIKPSNLMLVRESDGELVVKVIDFGLVKSALFQSTAGALTATGFVGTPYFASPEQLDQQTEDIRSDIYSLGVTLWYMLTGKPTFTGSVASVIAQHFDRAPSFDSLAILPGPVVALLRKMLEKDRENRFQTPAELRAELKTCLEKWRSAQPALARAAHDEAFETMAAGAATRGSAPPQIGATLQERYRLIEDLNPANPGRTFHAEDMVAKTRVMLRMLRVPAGSLEQIEQEADRGRGAAHPNFLEVLAIERGRGAAFAVLEWLEGFPLVELLRARHELTLRETLLLVQQIASAVDQARAAELKLETNLRDIIVHFPEGTAGLDAQVLLRCPLDEWPAFVVKLNPLGHVRELEGSDTWAGLRTIISSAQEQKERDVVQLGVLTYELLGGKSGGFSPLANISEAGNAILRRCLTPEQTYPTAAEFYEALRASAGGEVAPRARPERRAAEAEKSTMAALAPAATVPAAAPAPARSESFAERPSAPTAANSGSKIALTAGLTVFVLLCAGGLFWFWNFPAATPAKTTSAVAPAKPLATHAPLPPLTVGQPWTNSLEMPFVPLGDAHMAVAPTRVRDFSAFVEATGYDAVGGMSSVITKDGFKQTTMSWKEPGFAQTPEHPVVGVCWEDANQFCAWLTKKERNSGAIKSYQSYRLPTDREWSEALGLGFEPGATPEERSGKIKAVYPWGKTFPPPDNAANYAGTESRAGAPETWTFLEGFHDAFPRTAPVTAFPANERGVEIGGNVWEWCGDRFNTALNWRTLRGGSWATAHAAEMLSSYRRGYDPLFRNDDTGFRCVIANEGTPP